MGAIVVGCAYLLTIICLCLVYVRIYGIRKKKLVLKINRDDDSQRLVIRSDGRFVSDESYRVVSKPIYTVGLNSNRDYLHSSASGTYRDPQSWTGGIHPAITVDPTQIEGVRRWVVSVNTKSSELMRQFSCECMMASQVHEAVDDQPLLQMCLSCA